MKLNRLERYTAYCILLEEAEEILRLMREGEYKRSMGGGCVAGLCDLIESLIYRTYDNPIAHFNLSELLLKEPMCHGLYWWHNDEDGWNNRIAALRQCIEETHPDNPKNKRK